MFGRKGSRARDAHPPTSTPDKRRGTLPCAEPDCRSTEGVQCAYTDRRQRRCGTGWCRIHQQIAFNAIYCRRHAGIIRALGPDWVTLTLPDLDNRAPSLANWVGSDLNDPIRNLLQRFFPARKLNASTVVSGGSPGDRTWGRSWKLISANGVDLSINVTVPEANDSLVRVIYDGKVILEMVPPWIEARRRGMRVDHRADTEARRSFYGLILEDLEQAMHTTRALADYWAEVERGVFTP
jgi:hypothetical protein